MKVNSNSATGQRFINAFGTFDAAIRTSIETDGKSNDVDNTKALLWIGYNLDRLATSVEYVVNKQRASDKLRKEATETLKKTLNDNLPAFLERMKEAIAKTEESMNEEQGKANDEAVLQLNPSIASDNNELFQ